MNRWIRDERKFQVSSLHFSIEGRVSYVPSGQPVSSQERFEELGASPWRIETTGVTWERQWVYRLTHINHLLLANYVYLFIYLFIYLFDAIVDSRKLVDCRGRRSIRIAVYSNGVWQHQLQHSLSDLVSYLSDALLWFWSLFDGDTCSHLKRLPGGCHGCTLLRVRACLFCCFFRIIFAWVLLREGPFLLPVSLLLTVWVSSRNSPFHAGEAGRLCSVACRIPLLVQLAAVSTTQGAAMTCSQMFSSYLCFEYFQKYFLTFWFAWIWWRDVTFTLKTGKQWSLYKHLMQAYPVCQGRLPLKKRWEKMCAGKLRPLKRPPAK